MERLKNQANCGWCDTTSMLPDLASPFTLPIYVTGPCLAIQRLNGRCAAWLEAHGLRPIETSKGQQTFAAAKAVEAKAATVRARLAAEGADDDAKKALAASLEQEELANAAYVHCSFLCRWCMFSPRRGLQDLTSVTVLKSLSRAHSTILLVTPTTSTNNNTTKHTHTLPTPQPPLRYKAAGGGKGVKPPAEKGFGAEGFLGPVMEMAVALIGGSVASIVLRLNSKPPIDAEPWGPRGLGGRGGAGALGEDAMLPMSDWVPR